MSSRTNIFTESTTDFGTKTRVVVALMSALAVLVNAVLLGIIIVRLVMAIVDHRAFWALPLLVALPLLAVLMANHAHKAIHRGQ